MENIKNYINDIIPGGMRSERKDIAHGINIQVIAVMASILSIYYHIKDVMKRHNIGTAKFFKIDLITMLGIVLLTHIGPDIIANFDDKILDHRPLSYSIWSTITIVVIEVITASILLTPIFFMKNLEKSIVVVYIIATLLLIFNNLFILQNNILDTGLHLLLDFTIAGGVFLISRYLNNFIFKKNK
jgi:hypothetical protein